MSAFADVAVPAGIYLSGNLADLASTEYAREYGAHEANPHGQTYAGRLVLKSGATLALTGADLVFQRMERRYVVVDRPGFLPERRKTALAKAATGGKWILRAAALAYYAKVAMKNKRVGDDLREVPR